MPECSVCSCVAEFSDGLVRQSRGIPVQGHHAIRKPGHISRQRLTIHMPHANACEQLCADTARLEVHQGGGPNIERESSAPIESRASARLPVGLEGDRREPLRLQTRGGRHAGDPCPDECHVVHRAPPLLTSSLGAHCKLPEDHGCHLGGWRPPPVHPETDIAVSPLVPHRAHTRFPVPALPDFLCGICPSYHHNRP